MDVVGEGAVAKPLSSCPLKRSSEVGGAALAGALSNDPLRPCGGAENGAEGVENGP